MINANVFYFQASLFSDQNSQAIDTRRRYQNWREKKMGSDFDNRSNKHLNGYY